MGPSSRTWERHSHGYDHHLLNGMLLQGPGEYVGSARIYPPRMRIPHQDVTAAQPRCINPWNLPIRLHPGWRGDPREDCLIFERFQGPCGHRIVYLHVICHLCKFQVQIHDALFRYWKIIESFMEKCHTKCWLFLGIHFMDIPWQGW